MAEKTLNALSADLRRLYSKGAEALHRDNFDYAIDLFNQVLARDPAIYECRKALREAQARKAGAGKGLFRKILSSAGSQPHVVKAQVVLREDPAKAMQIAEQILNSDPENSQGHKLVVEAATALEMPKTAALSLEVLFRNHPTNVDTAIQYANALAEIGNPREGEKILAELSRDNPANSELAQALKDLSARKTLDEGGYDALADGSGSYRDILKDKEEAVSLEQQNRVEKAEDVAERLIREYESRVKAEPNNLKLIRSLAELYTQKKQFDRALQYYDQLKKSDLGNDASLDKSISDTVSRKIDYQVEQLDSSAPDYEERVAALKAEKQQFQLAECQKRVERFPTDLQIRFEMGQLYFQAGKISEAIQEFQKAQSNPHRRIAAKSLLAQCFARRRMYDLAARTLQDALKEKVVFDEEKKELIYNLGCVLESMGKKEEAIEQLKLIYEVDISYRDVAEKVDKYYSGQA